MASQGARRPRRHRRVRRHLPWTDGQSTLLGGDATPSQSGCPSPTACSRRPRGDVTVGGIVCTSNRRVRGDSWKILTRMSPYRWRDTGFQPRRIGSAAWKDDSSFGEASGLPVQGGAGLGVQLGPGDVARKVVESPGRSPAGAPGAR